MKTLDQIRAEYASGQVQNPSKEYRNLAKSLPALVMSNGLMQTLAFLKGKGKDEHQRLLNDILSWLVHPPFGVLPPKAGEFGQAMAELAGRSSMEYQRATEETLAILRWIRHLAATQALEDKP
jgi:CRISPR-associated protein Cmr5